MNNSGNLAWGIDTRFQLLSDLTVAINLSSSLEEKLQIITDKVREIIGCHQSVTSMTQSENWSQAITAVSLSDKYATWRTYQAPTDGSGIYALVCRTNKAMRFTQQELEKHLGWRGFGEHQKEHPPMRGWLAVPLIDQSGSNIGLIQLSDKWDGDFTEEDELILVQLAQIASISIENARLLHKLREALSEKEEVIKLNKTITDNATSALFMMNDKGYCTFMNPAGQKMFGFTAEEIKEQPLHYLIHHHHPDGSFYPMETCPIDRALPDNFDIRAHEDVFIRKDGTFFPVLCAASPIFVGGVPVSTVIEVRDVTEEKRTQQELLENIERIRFLLDAMPQMVWTAHADGSASYFNKNWIDYSGLSYQSSLENGWKAVVHPQDWDQTRQAWQQSLASGKLFQLEHRMRRQDGEYRWHLSRALAYKDAEDLIVMWIGTSTDIHDHKTLLEDLSSSNQQLKKINNDLDNFVYTASHDLKAPVLNIEGLMNALQKVLSPESLKRPEVGTILSLIMQSVHRFKGTIQDLTEISKIQKNLGEDISRLSFKTVIADVLANIQEQVKASGAEITVDTDAQDHIYYSRKDLYSILYNLLSNAVKYRSPERRPRIAIKSAQQQGLITLAVQDNGLGMRADQHEKAFIMFKRLHDHVEGSGVGLYIVKKILENSGDSIRLSSEEGKGSVFTLAFKDKSELPSATLQRLNNQPQAQ